MKIAIVGFGKMGRAVRDLALAQGHEITAELDVGQVSEPAVRGADVAIEFTQPGAAVANLTQLASWKVPVVCGTTGWYDHLPEVRAAVQESIEIADRTGSKRVRSAECGMRNDPAGGSTWAECPGNCENSALRIPHSALIVAGSHPRSLPPGVPPALR